MSTRPGSITTDSSGQQWYYDVSGRWNKISGAEGGIVVNWDDIIGERPDGSIGTATIPDTSNADAASEKEETDDTNTSSSSNGSSSSGGNYKTRKDRFSIEAAISDYAKDKWLYGNRTKRKKRKIQDGILRYPLQSLTSSTDYLQIDIGNYEPIGKRYVNTPGSSNRYVTSTSRGSSNSTAHLSTRPLINAGTILLPIPSQIKDTNTAAYNDSKMNGMAATFAAASEDLMNINWSGKGEEGDVATQLATLGEKAIGEAIGGTGNIDFIKMRLKKQFAAQAVSLFDKNVNPEDMLARSNGEILNPHMELLFSGPTLRNFRFSFKFTPRNELEAQQVKLIIRAFKQNMAPKVRGSAGGSGSGSWFLKTPNIFKIQYKSGNRNHPFLNKFKQCFLTNVDTSYTADGTYTTYDDGTPTSMILDLAFKETEPIYDDDYDQGPGTEGVGY